MVTKLDDETGKAHGTGWRAMDGRLRFDALGLTGRTRRACDM